MEKLKTALYFGADAAYLGGSRMNLRAFSANFDEEELQQAVEYAHGLKKRVYVTLNSIPHNADLNGLESYLKFLQNADVDALIVSDPGVISLAQKFSPKLPLHLSVQANCTNYETAKFFYSIGISRIILSRELSVPEIREIREKTPDGLELEAFVHGAMCMSYSGRCHMSYVMTGRDANRGACTQPCRWEYSLVEKTRPDQYYPVIQDEKGSYILSAYDLMMIDHLKELENAGICSVKIEGRMKTAFYVANVVNAYRRALDETADIDVLIRELHKASHRYYNTGFYYGRPENKGDAGGYQQEYDFIAVVRGYDEERHMVTLEQRNAFEVGDILEVLSPGQAFNEEIVVEFLENEAGEKMAKANLPQQIVQIPCFIPLKPMDILRRKRS